MKIFTHKLYLPDEREPAGNAFCILGFIDEVMSKAYEVTHEDERFNEEYGFSELVKIRNDLPTEIQGIINDEK